MLPASKKIINLKSQTAHVWYANTNIKNTKEHEYLTILSPGEKERASKFHFTKDRKRFIASHGILRILASLYLNKKAADIQFKYGEFGKPEFIDRPELKFNISHSGDLVVLGFLLDFEMGVDVELIKRDFDVLDIAQNFFSSKEIKSLFSLAKKEQNIGFFRCWTRKESFIKAKGSGLSFPLDQFAVSLDDDIRAELLETKWNFHEKDHWKLFSFIPAKNYIAALVARGEITAINYLNWDRAINNMDSYLENELSI